MAFMEWTEKLSVGVKQFDDEHRKLVSLVNQLSDAMAAGKGRELLGRTLDGLIGYTKTHFANEEKLFASQNYPGRVAHEREHQALARQVAEVQSRYQSGEVLLSVDLLAFLKRWLLNHIQGTDKKYTAFFQQQGLR